VIKITNQRTWGIIRYAAGSGMSPEDDCAAFDGWYSDRNEALAVYQDMCKRCPHWIVALVESEEIRFTDSAWEKVVPLDAKPICPLKRPRRVADGV
jgi:hypothetical protein